MGVDTTRYHERSTLITVPTTPGILLAPADPERVFISFANLQISSALVTLFFATAGDAPYQLILVNQQQLLFEWSKYGTLVQAQVTGVALTVAAQVSVYTLMWR